MHVALTFTDGKGRPRYFDYRYGKFHMEPQENAVFNRALLLRASNDQFADLSRDASTLVTRIDPHRDVRYCTNTPELRALGVSSSFNALLEGRRSNPLFPFTCVTLVGHLLSRVGIDHPLDGLYSATATGTHMAKVADRYKDSVLISDSEGMSYSVVVAAMNARC